jgi:hypothetical protein
LSTVSRGYATARSEGTTTAFQSKGAARVWPAHAATLGPILLLALAERLINLGAYSGLFDEGIRTEQLFLMTLGYRPFRDIFAAQGPLLLDAFFPFYVVLHTVVEPLVAARLVPVAFSLIGLAGIYWLGCQLAGRLAGAVAGLLLAVSPLYLEGSRLALAEVPALAPAILALGCALHYARAPGEHGQSKIPGSGWLALGGLLLTISLLMKPITLGAVPAFALAALLRGRRGLRDLILVGLAMLVLSGVVIWLLGFAQVQEQIFAYREAARRSVDWSFRKNLAALQTGLSFEPAALLPLAALGASALLVCTRLRALPVVVWGISGIVLLLFYSPLHGKHIVVAVPALTLLAGAGCVRGSKLLARCIYGRGALMVVPLAVVAVWYAVGLAPLLGQTGQLLRVTADTDVDPAFAQYSDAVATLRVLSGPDDFLVTDQPYLAFLAQRKVPPELVDTALARIRSRSLTGDKARAAASAFDTRLVLLWGDRLRSLPSFKAWVDREFQVVKVYNRRGDSDRALYLRRDQDFAAARARLVAEFRPGSGASFGALRLSGANVDRSELSSGQGATVTMLWEQLEPTSLDYHVLLDLRDTNGRTVDDQEESLGGGSEGTSHWPVGRWLVQSSFVKADDVAPGEYTVTVSLYDSKNRQAVPIDGDNGSRELTVGQLTVR